MAFFSAKNLMRIAVVAPLGLAVMPAHAQNIPTSAQDAVTNFDLCAKKDLEKYGWANKGRGPYGTAPTAAFSDSNQIIRSFRSSFDKARDGFNYNIAAEYRHGDLRDAKLYDAYFHISAFTIADIADWRKTDAVFDKVMNDYTAVRKACGTRLDCITGKTENTSTLLSGDDPTTFFHFNGHTRYWVHAGAENGDRVIVTYRAHFKNDIAPAAEEIEKETAGVPQLGKLAGAARRLAACLRNPARYMETLAP